MVHLLIGWCSLDCPSEATKKGGHSKQGARLGRGPEELCQALLAKAASLPTIVEVNRRVLKGDLQNLPCLLPSLLKIECHLSDQSQPSAEGGLANGCPPARGLHSDQIASQTQSPVFWACIQLGPLSLTACHHYPTRKQTLSLHTLVLNRTTCPTVPELQRVRPEDQ